MSLDAKKDKALSLRCRPLSQPSFSGHEGGWQPGRQVTERRPAAKIWPWLSVCQRYISRGGGFVRVKGVAIGVTLESLEIENDIERERHEKNAADIGIVRYLQIARSTLQTPRASKRCVASLFMNTMS